MTKTEPSKNAGGGWEKATATHATEAAKRSSMIQTARITHSQQREGDLARMTGHRGKELSHSTLFWRAFVRNVLNETCSPRTNYAIRMRLLCGAVQPQFVMCIISQMQNDNRPGAQNYPKRCRQKWDRKVRAKPENFAILVLALCSESLSTTLLKS